MSDLRYTYEPFIYLKFLIPNFSMSSITSSDKQNDTYCLPMYVELVFIIQVTKDTMRS